MKIALLHYTFWPEVGGVEHLMRDQANMLCRAGHEVTVVTGVGRETGEDYEVVVLPEMAQQVPRPAGKGRGQGVDRLRCNDRPQCFYHAS
jgi:hypothetical protein